MEYTAITLKLLDVTAKAESELSTDDKQDFVDLIQLKNDDMSIPKYATLEDNFFLLDGSFLPFPDAPGFQSMGYWSNSQSDENGNFTENPKITINFTEQHTAAGLTLTFLHDYPDEIKIRWFTLAGETILSQAFHPDALYYFCDSSVEDFGKIELDFIHTLHPYRYIKLADIKYGVIKDFIDEDVIDCTITEEVDPVSNTISINAADFTLHSRTGAFDLINPQGMFKLFQQSQELNIRRVDDAGITQFGTFFLDTWDSADSNSGQFTSYDSVGKLDKTQFRSGRIYDNEPAGNIIDEIMASAGFTKYEIAEELKSIPLSGWIKICTHREALQQVAFALGAIVDDIRSDTIRIYKGTQSFGRIIPRSRKFDGGSTKLLSYVSDVKMTAHNYVLSAESSQIINGTYPAGQYEIDFDAAYAELSATGATITEQHTNYAIISVPADGDVTLTGKKYTDQTYVYNYGVDKLPAGAIRNPIKIEQATLISSGNVADIAKSLFDYYQLRFQTEVEIILDQEKSGEKVALQRPTGTGYTMDSIEKMVIDLTGGFTARITTLSNGKDIVLAYYAGELYAGQDMGVL